MDLLNDEMNELIENLPQIKKLREEIEMQAVKDTAKEIFEKLFGFMGSKQKFVIVNDDHKTLIDCDELFSFVGQLAKEKGVEVE